MKLQEILDARVEKGAVYDGETILTGIYSSYNGNIILTWDDTHSIRSYSLSFIDILYGDSNFWEAIFGMKQGYKTDVDEYMCFEGFDNVELSYDSVSVHHTGRVCDYYKMQSTLYEDKVKYLSDLLTKDD